ncbi:MAG: hypothetical protein E7666_03165 [Ruminococcaceae bacterium]|nr:hypothetical protein [Oscillospiraceae bacterium]
MKWYLEDGHTLSQIAAWQERLSERGEAALTVLSRSLDTLRGEKIADMTEHLIQEWAEHLKKLLVGGEALARDLPRADGFFVGTAQRQATHAAVCRFFSPAGDIFSEMEQACVHLHALQESFLRAGVGEESLMQELIAAKYAAARIGDQRLIDAVAALSEAFYAVRERNSEGRRQINGRYEQMFAFCNRLFPDLAARIGDAADMEHEGASADTGRVAMLVAELNRLLHETARTF